MQLEIDLQQQQPSLLFPSKLGRLEMKPHEKKRYKTRVKKKGKTKCDKKLNQKKKKRQ
jgi:hypothetical protein